MSDRRLQLIHEGAHEADMELRRVEREGEERARRMSRRLARVDVHQQEARFILERAGMLTRRPRGA